MQYEWSEKAQCRDLTEKMFPEFKEDEEEAKAICVGCPCKAACLEFAIEHREPEGIWGGLNAAERRVVRRSRVA